MTARTREEVRLPWWAHAIGAALAVVALAVALPLHALAVAPNPLRRFFRPR